MKILLVNNHSTDHGGAEVMVQQLKAGLESAGYEVRVLAGCEDRRRPGFADYTFHDFKQSSAFYRWMYICNPFAVWRLYRVLRSFRPDIVHLHNVNRLSPFILPLLNSSPTVLTIHDHLVFDPTRIDDLPGMGEYKLLLSDYFTDNKNLRYYAEKLRFFLLRRFNKSIDVAVACSSFLSEAAKESGLFADVRTIHNGIQATQVKPMVTTPQILFAGRIESIKGVEALVEAVAVAAKTMPSVRLLVAGEGSAKQACEGRARELNVLGTNVMFIGKLPHNNVSQSIQESMVVAIPSLYPDNLPTIGLEAMSVGRPVIGSRVGGIPEIVVDDVTGFLVAPGNVNALADRIVTLLGSKSIAKRMGEAGRKRFVAEFSMDVYVTRILKLYDELRGNSI